MAYALKLTIVLVLKSWQESTKNMAANFETIGLQKYSVRRVLKYMLPLIDKDTCGIELRLVTILTYITDDKNMTHLK